MTLTWFDLIPVFGVVVTISGISLKAGRLLQKIDYLANDMANSKKISKKSKWN